MVVGGNLEMTPRWFVENFEINGGFGIMGKFTGDSEKEIPINVLVHTRV